MPEQPSQSGKPQPTSADIAFCRALPKIELHAHLSGSVTPGRLQEVWLQRKIEDPSFGVDLDPPEVWFAHSNRGQNIKSWAAPCAGLILSFFSHFNSYIYLLISSEAALAYITRGVLEDFAKDGVVYIELRTTPRKLSEYTTAEDALRVVLGVMSEWNAQPGQTLHARLIPSIDRSKHSPQHAMQTIRLALKLRDEGLPVVGVDLSGDPHGPLLDYQEAFDLAHRHHLPASLHFAEVPSVTEDEMTCLLGYHPRRLGHVIHVPPSIRRTILDRKLHVELLLTCNILGGMLPDESADPGGHHFGWWHAQGGGLSIGTDDVGVFGAWVSDEYDLVSRHFGLGRRETVRLVKRGIDGMFDEGEKDRVGRLVDSFERDL